MEAVSSDGWEVFDHRLPLLGAKYGPQRARMAVIGLGGGELLVVSPGTALSEAQWQALARWGTPRFLLAPNHFHNAGLAQWKDRFPEARLVSHPRAQARLRKKVPGQELGDLNDLEAALPSGVRLFSPPMAKQGETWVSVATEGGRAWFVTDGIINQKRLPGGPMGLFMKAVGFQTRLMINPIFKRVFLADRQGYKDWVMAELERDKPTLFIPAHGEVLKGKDVTRLLQEATRAA